MSDHGYTVICEPLVAGGFQVILPALPDSSASDACWKEARAMAQDAITCHLKGLVKDGEEIPEDPFVRGSSSGVLTAVGSGGVDITASVDQHDASAHLQVPFVITGVVHESAPTEEVALAGARVEIQSGPEAGKVMTTDDTGRFTVEVENAGFTLLVSRDGYDPASFTIASLPPPASGHRAASIAAGGSGHVRTEPAHSRSRHSRSDLPDPGASFGKVGSAHVLGMHSRCKPMGKPGWLCLDVDELDLR